MLVVAIDPGLTGACAVLDHTGLRALFDLPTMQIPGVGPTAMVQRKLDGRALCAELLKACPAAEGKPTVVIEAVATMGGQNNAVQTQGSLLRTLGAAETVPECLGWPVTYVQPQTWKRHFGLVKARGEDRTSTQAKSMSLETARRLFPGADIGKAKHHNRAESILLAAWMLQRLS